MYQQLNQSVLPFLALLQAGRRVQGQPMMADEGDEAFLQAYQQRGYEGQPQQQPMVNTDLAEMPRSRVDAALGVPAQRQRVNPLNVLGRALAPNTFGALDAERARLQAEADRPQRLAIMQENEEIARGMGPGALLAFRANPEAFGESLGYQHRPTTTGAGGVSTVFGTGQQVEAPRTLEFGNDLIQTGPISGTQVLATRGPSYSEQAQIARLQQDANQAERRLALDYDQLDQNRQQFDQRLGFDQSKVESRPLSPTQQRQVEAYYQEDEALGNIDTELGRFDQMIAAGDLELSPAANASGRVRNLLGMSTPNSQNLAEFQSTLERIRNDSLRLNNGVQTEGDSQRAWNELVTNINDPAVVRRQIQRIRQINDRARNFRRQRLSAIEGQQYGAGEQPSAPTGGSVSRDQARAILRARGVPGY